MYNGYNSVISLDDLMLKVNLGVSDEEMEKPQDAKVSFKIYFKRPPLACETDNVKDTVCYFKLSNIITEYCSKNKFRLLENMCMQLYRAVRAEIENTDTKIWIKAEKCHPPVANLAGTTAFEYSDF